MSFITKATSLFCFCFCLVLPICLVVAEGDSNNLLDIEPPMFFTYKSPLREPDSLRNQPYFDFLSTLYRHDTDKTNLFRPYTRQARSAVTAPMPAVGTTAATAAAGTVQVPGPVQFHAEDSVKSRQKRAIVFRPLFVYRQQQIRKQRLYEQRKRRY